ncbi:MAG TPA: hypothetical protein VK249_25675 [Anaerolineales bacterium]|nr:hypothetical protein [Anaerolineales bacterium]
MSEKLSRALLVLETIIALRWTGFAILISLSLLQDLIWRSHLFHVVALAILGLISLSAIASGLWLFIVFALKGGNELKKQHQGWWIIGFAGALLFVSSSISYLLEPSFSLASSEYFTSSWWAFRGNFDGLALGVPMLIPLCHLVFERFLRKSSSLRSTSSVEG